MSLTMTTDNIYATKILNIILKPFTEQEAYRLGVIDAKGDQIKKPKSQAESDAYNPLFVVLFKIKQILNKLPASQSRLAQVSVALQLIRQKNIPSQYRTGLAEDIAEEYLKRLIFVSENSLRLVEEEQIIKAHLENIVVEDGESVAAGTTTSGIEPQGEPVIKPKKKKLEESKYQTLYVHRTILNRDDFVKWADRNGIDKIQDSLHTTICYSKNPVGEIAADDSKVTIPQDTSRHLSLFGKDNDTLVLEINSPEFESRWKQFINAGASWDWPDYKPHVTITINTKGIDVSSIEPYDGIIEYGPEVFEELVDDWHEKATES